MRYAVISDIHGNLPALEAVLADCALQGVDDFLFLGDYYGDFPFVNEVLDLVRAAGGHAILGNKETRMLETYGKPQTPLQFSPLSWNLAHIRADNLRWLESLPQTLSLPMGSRLCRLAHASAQFLDCRAIETVRGDSPIFTNGDTAAAANADAYSRYAARLLAADADFCRALRDVPGDVFLFGHFHVQWYAEIEGNLLLNPGSCGLPLDFDGNAAYAILDAESLAVTLRRVPYDRTLPVRALRESDFYDVAPLWHELCLLEFAHIRCFVQPFLRFAEALARERNAPIHPFANDLWQEALCLYTEKLRKEGKMA